MTTPVNDTITDPRTFWVVERFENGKSAGYWEGGSSRTFIPEIDRAIQFCRRQDAMWVIAGWHWKDVEITEHMMFGSVPRAGADTLPSPVTDEMIDKALNAWFSGSQSETDQALERSMRRALEAAFVPRASTMPRTDREREDHILDCYAVIKEKDAEIERFRARALAMPSEDRAKTLLENTKRLRFFKGEVYDGGADEYLRQLHSFLADYLAFLSAPQAR